MGKEKGYTFVELIVAMAIFVVVIMAISVTFNNLISQGGKQARSATGQIEGIVGLEMFRADAAHAGFALPWTYPTGFTLAANVEAAGPPVTGLGIDAVTFANFSETGPPHPVLAAPTNAASATKGPYYLVLKSALLALNTTSPGRWGFVSYSSSLGVNVSHIKMGSDPATNLRAAQDRVITLLSAFSPSGDETKQLLVTGSTFSYTLPSTLMPINDAFKPADPSQNVLAYAISDSDLRMPYNRADYYIDFNPAKRPTSCNPNTGVLYKAVAGQLGTYKDANGVLLSYPLLNCVGDMQVVFALDPSPNHDGPMIYYAPDSSVVTGLSAQALSTQLRNVRVYILAQEGKKDQNFSYPGTSILVGETGIGGRTWDGSSSCTTTNCMTTFGADWKNYRWKVYSFVVNMNNL